MSRRLEGFSLVARRWRLAVFWMGVMILLSMNWASLKHTNTWTLPLFFRVDPAASPQEAVAFFMGARKLMHVLEFAIFTLLLWKLHLQRFPAARVFQVGTLAFTIGIALLFAVGTEIIQLFFVDRIASPRDVLIDMSGAVLGLGIAFFLQRRSRPLSPPVEVVSALPEPSPAPRDIRALITADLHLDPRHLSHDFTLAHLHEVIARTQPDLCIIAGDIGPASQASECLSALREAAGIPLVICLGNQDHWIPPSQWPEFSRMEDIRQCFWLPAAASADVHCLDFDNFHFERLTIAGGYGHYDLAMRPVNFKIPGSPEATLQDYLAGRYAGLGWSDMLHIPHASETLIEEARFQADSICSRLTEASGSGGRLLLVTHTVPFSALIGHRHRRNAPAAFFDAYAGNSLLGARLGEFASFIDFAACAHTHQHVPPLNVLGFPCANIGGGYDSPRFLIYDTASNRLALVPTAASSVTS